MNQAELNQNYIQAILFYCYQINNTHFFNTWASDVCTLTYNTENNLIIFEWFLDNVTYNIPQPTNETLMTYNVSDVLNFHDECYLFPENIFNANQNAYFFATTSELNAIPTTRLVICDGYRAFDTTIKRVVFWNNTAQAWQES